MDRYGWYSTSEPLHQALSRCHAKPDRRDREGFTMYYGSMSPGKAESNRRLLFKPLKHGRAELSKTRYHPISPLFRSPWHLCEAFMHHSEQQSAPTPC